MFEANVNESITPYSLYVDEETSIEEVYAKFIEDEVLLTPEGFLLLANKKGLVSPKPGHYIIKSGQSSNSIVNTLMAGFQEPVTIQFNSAHDLEDLAGQLSKQIMADNKPFGGVENGKEGWEGAAIYGAYLPDVLMKFIGMPLQRK